MKKIHEGGNALRNIGLFILLFHIGMFFTSSLIYAIKGNELWFSRAALASILLGLYLIADKKD